MKMKTKTLEHCAGSKSPVFEHKLANTSAPNYRVCRFCDKIVTEYQTPQGKWVLRAHGRLLSIRPPATLRVNP